ncbi:MAG: DUF87 domain-containing protein [Planctomycetota bacterium]
MIDPQDYEKLAAFYLGREVDDAGALKPGPLLYDAKDLCTHGVIVGMTGSGKTGLAVGLLEEAAIDGVPSIVIDPKGDMGNLCLTFPALAPADFEPWVDAGEALRKGKTVPEFAAGTAKMWREGLAAWGQAPDRIDRLRAAAEVRLWTPGSTAGHPLTVLKSFDAPTAAVLADGEAFSERVQATTAGLLGLIGLEADPVQSRETILVANLLQHAWRGGRSVTVADLILGIQNPPFTRLGVLDVEAFYPAKDRMTLAMRLNGLLASPSFAAWLEGEPLDIQRLLYAPDGRPRVSILCLSHLTEQERISFVTVLLGEVLAWVRTQPGTSSLRALLYMDEIFGYFPPTANPPTKRPMLTLLKQARAYGLGVLLSTQNPVDLDYKGLSNCGTWFLGRLQTERDKLRVLDGLEGALAGAAGFDRATLERTLSGLGKRRFLLHNVHETHPVVFETRWAMSYLRGPITRSEIERIVAADKVDPPSASEVAAERHVRANSAAEARVARAAADQGASDAAQRPSLPDEVLERFLPIEAEVAGGLDQGERVLYRPSLTASAKLHYVQASVGVDEWRTLFATTALEEEEPAVRWDEGELAEDAARAGQGGAHPREGAGFAALPARASKKTTWTGWQRELKDHVYQSQPMTVYRNKSHKLVATPRETEAAFRARVRQAEVEARDFAVEKLRASYTKKVDAAAERMRKAEEALGREEAELDEKSKTSWISVGASLIDALFSRKKAARGASSAASKRAKVAKEKADVERAERELVVRRQEYQELEAELRAELDAIPPVPTAAEVDVEEVVVHPRKSDIDISELTVVWSPWVISADGATRPGSTQR